MFAVLCSKLGCLGIALALVLSAAEFYRPPLALAQTVESKTPTVRYSTDFPNTENPISENGAWHHQLNPWAVIRTVSGPNRAVGTQSGSDGFNDSYAYLLGFPPDVVVSATIYKDPKIDQDPAGSHEVELLLRMADTANTVRGYECNLAFDGSYSEIGRWNGKFGDFTGMSRVTSFPSGTMPPVTGDVFTATISGSTIKVYINKNDGKGDQLINTATDSTWADGNPGLGMWLQSRLGMWKQGRFHMWLNASFDQTAFAFTSFNAKSD
jgi:hypothetical protein